MNQNPNSSQPPSVADPRALTLEDAQKMYRNARYLEAQAAHDLQEARNRCEAVKSRFPAVVEAEVTIKKAFEAFESAEALAESSADLVLELANLPDA